MRLQEQCFGQKKPVCLSCAGAVKQLQQRLALLHLEVIVGASIDDPFAGSAMVEAMDKQEIKAVEVTMQTKMPQEEIVAVAEEGQQLPTPDAKKQRLHAKLVIAAAEGSEAYFCTAEAKKRNTAAKCAVAVLETGEKGSKAKKRVAAVAVEEPSPDIADVRKRRKAAKQAVAEVVEHDTGKRTQ